MGVSQNIEITNPIKLKNILKPIAFSLFFVIKKINYALRVLTAKAHRAQMWLEWKFLDPEWMDHYCDLYYQWPDKRNSLWLERGVFSSICLSDTRPTVLELCCGDGFNTKYFYSKLAKNILAIDFDRRAIDHAKKYNKADNIRFECQDIREIKISEKYDNIIWDAAIEHFNEQEIDSLMNKIRESLKEEGILSGYTLVEKEDGSKHLHQHEYEFSSKEDLKRFLTPHFKKVKVFETKHKERHNLYFFATNNGHIPFDSDWQYQTKYK